MPNFNPVTMKTLFKNLLMGTLLGLSVLYVSSCDEDDEPQPQLTGDSESYTLAPVANSGISGTVTIAERDDDQVLITLQMTGTQSGASHPAHIHTNSGAEGGGIVISLTAVDGATGKSETVVSALDDGTALTYEELLEFDGHVNVHRSPDDLSVVAQGDIGVNVLTGDVKEYVLGPVSNPDINGTATFEKRVNGETLVTVALLNTADGETYPSHIHGNSAVETGGILIDLNDVNGTTGMAITNVSQLNDGTAITYEGLLDFDGYINVHSGATFIAQGDIGGNELTGNEKIYTLTPVADPAVSGTATFAERKNGNTLVTVALENTQDGATHASHIHANSIVEGGPIVIDLNNVDGTSGMARTNVRQMNDGTAITYEGLLDFNGYLNVHAPGGTFVVQGDIGQNEFTGDEKVYTLTPVADPAVSGTATFAKRKNGSTLVAVELQNTQAGASHPSHIHANTIVEGGSIVINLNNVDGTTGMALTNVKQMNDGTPITYEELLDFNGYLNVHAPGGTFVVQGDIGQNELTGDEKVYTLTPVADPAVSGTATFAKRKNSSTLVTVALENTQPGATHASHIHANTIAEGGGIVIDLNNVDGTTGMALTNVTQLNDGTAITYEELLDFNGYLNVHAAGGTFVVQGDIGQNELTGDKKDYALAEVEGSGVSGTATFAKRKNGKTQITLLLTGTVAGGDHPAHIHANDMATGGGIVLDLENVDGATGKSVTSANALNDGTAITYDELINFNGHINVHQSPTVLGTRIARGNIGANAL